jgi:uncharacterized protein YPO0396
MGLARYAGRKYGSYKKSREDKRMESNFYKDQAREAYKSKKARLDRQKATNKQTQARAKGRYIAEHGTLGWLRHKAKQKRAAMKKKRSRYHHKRK